MIESNIKNCEELPYERCINYGPEVLTDAELIAVILRTGAKHMDVLELSYEILKINDSNGILGLLHNTKEQYMSLKGIGKVKSVQLLCIGEIAKRIWLRDAENSKNKLNEPSACARYYMQKLRCLEQEELRIVYLDNAFQFISDSVITKGTVNTSLVPIREILIDTLKHRAVKVIVVHNHPSGNPNPSICDKEVTVKLKNSFDIIGIDFVDHIIIGDNQYYSFKEWGIL